MRLPLTLACSEPRQYTRHSLSGACRWTGQQYGVPASNPHSRISASTPASSVAAREKVDRQSFSRSQSRVQSRVSLAGPQVGIVSQTRRQQRVRPCSRNGSCAWCNFDCQRFSATIPSRTITSGLDALPLRKRLITSDVSLFASLATFARLRAALPGWTTAWAGHFYLQWSLADER